MWCEEQTRNEKLSRDSINTFNNILRFSSSAGQLVRVLPFLGQFLPDKALNSLSGAERKSRWPKDLADESSMREQIEQLHNALAIASLLDRETPSAHYDVTIPSLPAYMSVTPS
jgi:hypothetical protein